MIDCLSFCRPFPVHDEIALTCALHHLRHQQFGAVENGITVTKLMQIFSRQAAMMDALISHFADQMRRRKDGTDVVDNVADDGEFLLPLALVHHCRDNIKC